MVRFIQNIFLVCLLAVPSIIEGQQPIKTLSLNDCISKVFDNNSGFTRIENLESIRKHNRRVMQTGIIPDISASASANQFVQNSTIIFTDNILPPSEINGARTTGLLASINASMSVQQFGQTIASLKSQRFDLEAQTQKDVTAKNQIISAVCQTFFDCLLSQESLQTIKERTDISKEILKIAAVKVTIGESDSIEYYQAMINYQNDLDDLRTLQILETDLMNSLKIILGEDIQQVFTLDNRALTSFKNSPSLITENEAHSTASAKALAYEIDALHAQQNVNRWNFIPNASVFSGYGYSNQTFQNGIVQQNAALGFSYGLSINYNIGTVKNSLHQSKISQLELENKELQLIEEIKFLEKEQLRLKAQLSGLRESINTNETVLKIANRTLTNAIIGYKSGSISIIELRLSQNQHLSSKLDLKRSYADLLMCEITYLSIFHNLEDIFLKNSQ